MRDVTLNRREQAGLQALNGVMEYQLPRIQAAEILGISEGRLRRVLASCRRDGATGSASHASQTPRTTLPPQSSWPAGNTPASTIAA